MMPELPEVETIVRDLAETVGSTIEKIQILDRELELPAKEIMGSQIASIGRRGKYIVFQLDPAGKLVFHMRMSGRLLRICAEGEWKYSRLVLHLSRGVIHFVDPRRLGTVEFCCNGFPHTLGIDPFDKRFTPKRLTEIVGTSRGSVKCVLMDQRKIAGIGNIYASEALWRAMIDPRRTGNSLEKRDLRRLHPAIVELLNDAILHMGCTLGDSVSDYRSATGESGEFQDALRVYGREGEPCDRCGETIAKIKQAGRSTYFCPHCQS